MGLSERKCVSKGTMEVLGGFCPTAKKEPAVGRLIAWREGDLPPRHGAFLSVFRQIPSRLSDCEGQMGVILVGSSSVSGEALANLSCPILMISDFPEHCLGRIGLLDSSVATLFVSPDLPTVTRYAEYWHRQPLTAFSEADVKADGKSLRWEGIQYGAPVFGQEEWIVDRRHAPWDLADAEEACYELYCDIADCAVGTNVTVLVTFDRDDAERGAFRAMIRGIFRAAVYGSFSILICGCLTESDVQDAREQMHRAFCELESEGREFNGYISKGILIDRPLLMLTPRALAGVDFVCLDLAALFLGFTGQAEREEGATAELWRMLGSVLLDWRETRGGGRICALLRGSFPSAALCRVLLLANIRDWFFLSSDLWETKLYLRELVEAEESIFQKIFEEKEENFSKST